MIRKTTRSRLSFSTTRRTAKAGGRRLIRRHSVGCGHRTSNRTSAGAAAS